MSRKTTIILYEEDDRLINLQGRDFNLSEWVRKQIRKEFGSNDTKCNPVAPQSI